MRVYRGQADTIEADRERTEEIVRRAARESEPALRVWTPHRQVAFGRRDENAAGFERAREAAEQRGFPAYTRSVGGRAVAFSGSTLAVVHARPLGNPRSGIQARYDEVADRLRAALAAVGVAADTGEPPDSFCPGTHSLQAAGGKIAGIAQRVTSDVASVAAVLVVADHRAIADVLAAVYGHLGVPFDRESVGSVASAGGPEDPEPVADAAVEAVRAG